MHLNAQHPKVRYFLASASKWLRHKGTECPACGCSRGMTLSRKYVVTILRECAECGLRFRTPTTSAAEAAAFYQRTYKQGLPSSIPNDDEIAQFLKTGFGGLSVDFSNYIRLLQALGIQKNQTIYDFGCSWGYGSWQFQQAGFRVRGFEISVPRCTVAREKLGIDAHPERATGKFDVFFAAHVIEHVPSPTEMVQHALDSVKPGGWIVLISPNGSDAMRDARFTSWNQLWGDVHPQLLSDGYYQRVFEGRPHLLASSPYKFDTIAEWAKKPHNSLKLDLTGDELLLAVRVPFDRNREL